MAQWQMELDFVAEGKAYRAGEIGLEKLAEAVVVAIKAGIPKAKQIDEDLGYDLEYEVLPLFEEIAEADDIVYTVRDFDYALEALYDWADTPLDDKPFGGKKMCWVVPNFD